MEPEDFPGQMSRTKHLKGYSVLRDRSLRVLDRRSFCAGRLFGANTRQPADADAADADAADADASVWCVFEGGEQ